MRRIAAVILLLAGSASGAELTITSGGRRAIDINPPGTTCRAWSYGAMPVAGDGGTIDTIYTVGDVLTNHCREGLTSPDRFGDRIWRHARNGDGTWSGAPVIARDALPWMTAPLTDSYVSHLASPAVVRSGGKWYMAFAASVSDPNLCAAEHGASTSCGSCVSPWSHFALLWAVSDDGITWRVRDGGGSSSNPALAAAVLWREPNVADTTSPPSAYKAIARVSMLLGTDNGKAYFYLLGMFWGRLGAKEILVRIPYDAAAPWGLGGDPEVVHYQHPSYVWEACPGGRMPEWLDDVNSYSIVNGFFNAFTSSVFATTRVPGYRYVALGVGHGTALAGYGGRNNLVAYQLSNDLMNWTSMRFVRSVVPFFGDGLGYTASIIDPIAVQDGSGTIHLYMASNDGDDARSIARDGAPDCATDPSFGATAVYVGIAIYRPGGDRADHHHRNASGAGGGSRAGSHDRACHRGGRLHPTGRRLPLRRLSPDLDGIARRCGRGGCLADQDRIAADQRAVQLERAVEHELYITAATGCPAQPSARRIALRGHDRVRPDAERHRSGAPSEV